MSCCSIFIGLIFLAMSISTLVFGTIATVDYRKDSGLLHDFCEKGTSHVLGDIADTRIDGNTLREHLCGRDRSFAVDSVANIMGIMAVWSGIEALLSAGFMWGASQESIPWTTAWLVGTSCWATLLIALTISSICSSPQDYFIIGCILGTIYSVMSIFCIMIVLKYRKELLNGTSLRQVHHIHGVAVVNPTLQMAPAYPPHWQTQQGVPITTQPYHSTNPYPTTSPYPTNNSHSPNQENGDKY